VSRLSTLSESDLSENATQALAGVRQNGKLSPIYLQFANSEPALLAYLGMEASLAAGGLNNREIETIKLWVSEYTGCEYCLSVHSWKGSAAGLSTEWQLLIRQGSPTGDERLDVLLVLMQQLFEVRGEIPDGLLGRVRAAGYTDQQLLDITMVISTIFFTNLTNHINASVSALPPAPPIKRI